MMPYNKVYIDVNVALITAIMSSVPRELLDVSYEVKGSYLDVQFVLLEGHTLPSKLRERVIDCLRNYDFRIHTVYISQKDFNENEGSFNPKQYKWLNFLLLSKLRSI
jgi:hypothetical protein